MSKFGNRTAKEIGSDYVRYCGGIDAALATLDIVVGIYGLGKIPDKEAMPDPFFLLPDGNNIFLEKGDRVRNDIYEKIEGLCGDKVVTPFTDTDDGIIELIGNSFLLKTRVRIITTPFVNSRLLKNASHVYNAFSGYTKEMRRHTSLLREYLWAKIGGSDAPNVYWVAHANKHPSMGFSVCDFHKRSRIDSKGQGLCTIDYVEGLRNRASESVEIKTPFELERIIEQINLNDIAISSKEAVDQLERLYLAFGSKAYVKQVIANGVRLEPCAMDELLSSNKLFARIRLYESGEMDIVI